MTSKTISSALPELESPEAFKANPKIWVLQTKPDRRAFELFDVLLKKACAGMNERAVSEDVFKALKQLPGENRQINATIRWFFGSIQVPFFFRLFSQCGIPLGLLVEHVRAVGLTRQDLIIPLNQFAEKGTRTRTE